MILSQIEWNIMTMSMTSSQVISTQQKLVDKEVLVEYQDIFTSSTRVPLHYQVKHSIDLILYAPFPNEQVYGSSLLENK